MYRGRLVPLPSGRSVQARFKHEAMQLRIYCTAAKNNLDIRTGVKPDRSGSINNKSASNSPNVHFLDLVVVFPVFIASLSQ